MTKIIIMQKLSKLTYKEMINDEWPVPGTNQSYITSVYFLHENTNIKTSLLFQIQRSSKSDFSTWSMLSMRRRIALKFVYKVPSNLRKLRVCGNIAATFTYICRKVAASGEHWWTTFRSSCSNVSLFIRDNENKVRCLPVGNLG